MFDPKDTEYIRLPNCYVGCNKVLCVYNSGGICPTPNVCKGNSDAACYNEPNYVVKGWLILDKDK